MSHLPALLLLLSELSELLLTAPRIRLLESAICRAHLSLPSPPESACKIPAVQTRLAHVRGWQVFFDALPILALAVPWGAVADRVSRRRVLGINFLGCAAHIAWFVTVCRAGWAVEWVWAGSAAFALGGGPRTAGVLILAVAGESVGEEERSTRLYRTYAAFLVTELVAMPAAGVLMGVGEMAPFVVALVALGVCFPVLMAVEERRGRGRGEGAGLLADAGEEQGKGWGTVVGTLVGTVGGLWRYVKREVAGADRNLLLVLLGHFICPVRQELVFQVLIPYTSKLFSQPIAQAALLLSLVAFTNLLVFLFALPWLTEWLRHHHHLTATRIDALTASSSSLLLAAGCLLIAFAGSYPMLVASTVAFSAGFGIRLGLLSLLTAVVEPGKVGRAYTLVTVVEGTGEMVSAPVLQGLWAWGLQRGGVWRGAPWCAGAAVYAAAWWWIKRVRVGGDAPRAV